MNYNSKNGLIIVAPIKFADKEYFIPKHVFEDNNYIIKTASTNNNAISMQNVKIMTDLKIDQIAIKEYAFIVIAGGFGVKQSLWNDLILTGLVKKAFEQGVIIGAICLAPVILARAGILNKKKATVFRRVDTLKEFSKYGVEYIDDEVVEVGNIVTAKAPRSSELFAKAILNKIV